MDRSMPYQTAGSWRIKKILSSMSIGKNDSIIDYGCGKGKTIYTLSKFPFTRVDGVEISDVLCNIAKKNMQKSDKSSKRHNDHIF